MAKKKMKSVPFEHIVCDDTFNARTDYDASDIDALASSILKSGLLQPIGVTELPEKGTDDRPRYSVVYGFRRYKALVQIRGKLGEDAYATLDVVLNEGTLEELRDRNLRENIDRKNLKPHEIANAIKQKANAGLEQRDIAASLGRPQSWVSYHYKAATKLGVSAKRAFEAGDITLEQALNIADVPEDAQEDVVTKVLNASTRSEARKVAKAASKAVGTRRTYVNKGRPTAKNLAQFVSDASFDAAANEMVDSDQAFFNGLAAGIRVALGDLDFEKIKCTDSYVDMNYHATPTKAEAAGGKAGSNDATKKAAKTKSAKKPAGRKTAKKPATRSSKSSATTAS